MAWSISKLGSLLNIQSGYAFDSKKFVDEGGVPLIRIRDISDGYNTVVNYEGDYDDKYLVKNGDYLIGMDGEFRCYEWKGKNALLNQRVCRLEGFDNSLYSRFLFYGINKYLRDIENVTAFTTVKHISAKQIKDIEFPIPPIPEQKRIVAILDQAFDDIDKARALTEQNLINARELFESYLQQVFSQRGEGWTESTLGEITGGVFTGPFGSLLHKKDYIENGIPLVNPAHITSSGIEPDRNKTVSQETAERLSSYVVSEGDIVIGRRGEMGRCALVSSIEEGFLCGTGSFFIKSSEKVLGGYLVRYLRSAGCVARLEKIAGGAVMPNLSNSDLSNFKLAIPPVSQQSEILILIDKLSIATQEVMSVYQKKLSRLDELRKSLLQKAFSGELTKDKQEAA